ncbi:hypothetical protein K7395_01085 [Streptomyces filamentosus]|uniref:Secreted protein n=2 Tax=Streptomyces filamentosus TaxID=67294 RepID=A0ABY4UMT2_STRFL|nr:MULTISPECIES: hypothetical protein [Streptomyces]EFE79337.1 conserved hypothetical protein [Streptomyces filamentosus NRRL 15998]ESU46339.1 hypothetical protein P376_5685 [Streptomyces sp. HCCB10043]EWS96168.1 hypothetical protein SSIG_06974 [Streptomyces filamentosus NRRL 11379]MYR83161.1 hypothetical protein [Streptomyces sp. SID5466]USC45415.1 hypothetical protein K7395_01085 [Streptomyces filamentosus]
MRNLRTALVTVMATGLAVTALAQVPAAAAPAPAPAQPKFLSAGQLPASHTPWTAGPVRKGVPAEGSVCTSGIAPAAGTRHRDFRTELDTNARQTITVAATTAQAKKLAADLRSALETCLDRLKDQDPGLEGEALYQGRINVEEGAHVYSIDTSYPEVGSTDIGLFSVGRDGRAVTVVEWGQLGELDGAPLEGFKKTTRTAVAKLY